jgi:hypothetical protein
MIVSLMRLQWIIAERNQNRHRELYTGSQVKLEEKCWDDIIEVTSSGSLILQSYSLYIVFSLSRNHQSREIML